MVSHFYFGDPAPSSFNFGIFGGNLLATHPPIDQRILKLAQYHGGVPPTVIEGAVKAGQQFGRGHPEITENDFAPVSASDELSVLTVGNTMGRVCRVAGLAKPAPLYDRPDLRSPILRRIQEGDLLVVFDDPGKYRQVITSDQTFGYIPLSVKLKKADMFPNEVFGMASPSAAPASTPVSAPESAPVRVSPPAVAVALVAALEPVRVGGLTFKQLGIIAAVFVGVFGAMILAMMQFGGK